MSIATRQRGIVPRKENGTKVIFLQFLPLKRLLLHTPLSLIKEQSPNLVIVSNSDLELFGYGDTESEAIRDFSHSLEEFYFSLKKNRRKLSKNLALKLIFLTAIISEK